MLAVGRELERADELAGQDTATRRPPPACTRKKASPPKQRGEPNQSASPQTAAPPSTLPAGLHAASSHRTSSGPTRVMSPAPRVRTTSPGHERIEHPAADVRAVGSNMASAPAPSGRVRHLAAAHAGHRLLPRRVDLGHDHQVGGGQRLTHRLPVRRGAGVQVRLEHRHEPPPGKGLPRRRERRDQLRRMVRVVVDHLDAAVLAQPLEPPAHAAELRQRRGGPARGHRRGRQRRPAPRRRCAGCAGPAPEGEAERAGFRASAIVASVRSACCATSVIRTSASSAEPKRQSPRAEPARDPPRPGIVGAHHSASRPGRRTRRTPPRAPPSSRSTRGDRARRCSRSRPSAGASGTPGRTRRPRPRRDRRQPPGRCRPRRSTRPPAMPVGASPAAVSASVVITVVVVLPWVPETATDARLADERGQRLLPRHHRDAAAPGRRASSG